MSDVRAAFDAGLRAVYNIRHQTSDIRLSRSPGAPTTVLAARAVAPAAYVELRALEIAQAEIERLGHRAEPKERPFTHFLKRLWPFDYPAKSIDPSPPAPMTPATAANAKGRYLDVIV